jgi:hypothetical protein
MLGECRLSQLAIKSHHYGVAEQCAAALCGMPRTRYLKKINTLASIAQQKFQGPFQRSLYAGGCIDLHTDPVCCMWCEMVYIILEKKPNLTRWSNLEAVEALKREGGSQFKTQKKFNEAEQAYFIRTSFLFSICFFYSEYTLLCG